MTCAVCNTDTKVICSGDACLEGLTGGNGFPVSESRACTSLISLIITVDVSLIAAFPGSASSAA